VLARASLLTRWLRTVLGAVAVAVAAALAYSAGAQATRRREQAGRERDLAARVTAGTRDAREAVGRAEKHERAADAASERARKRIDRIARTDPTVEELVDAWNR
jgi:hypothetical protein